MLNRLRRAPAQPGQIQGCLTGAILVPNTRHAPIVMEQTPSTRPWLMESCTQSGKKPLTQPCRPFSGRKCSRDNSEDGTGDCGPPVKVAGKTLWIGSLRKPHSTTGHIWHDCV